jgi:hypothetical protein
VRSPGIVDGFGVRFACANELCSSRHCEF